MAKVDVSAKLLKWAVARSGRTLPVIAHAFPKLERWIKGEAQPTFKQLEDFASATYVPLGYFFLDDPPLERLPIPFYRTVDVSKEGADISANLFDTIQMMKFRQDWMREHLVERQATPLSFIRSAALNESEEKIAQHARDVLGLKPLWAATHQTWTAALDTLRHAIEGIGVLVVVNGIVGNNTHRKLDPQEFRGFVLIDEFAPLLFVNGADWKAAQMFTLAHELAHLLLGESAAFDLKNAMPANNVMERKCDRIAAEFLVPRAALNDAWKGGDINDIIPKLAKTFKVSEIVIARRVRDLDYITKNDFFNYYNTYLTKEKTAKEAKVSSGGDFYASQKFRIGTRFGEAVVCAAREGSILYSEAYRLTGLRGKTFDEFAYSIGCEV